MIELCGKCLHARDSHTPDNGHFMYCAKCQRLCDVEEYNTNYKPSGTIVQDGYVYKMRNEQ